MAKSSIAFLASLCALLSIVGAEEVVTLTESNFDSTISDNQFVLVEFYAPWCGHCKALAPEYEKAAVALKDYEPKVVIAKVDATAEESLGQKFEVQGFPTLKWFVNGKPMDYGGGRVEAEIVQWVKKKTGPPALALENAAAVDTFKAEADVVVVGVFKDEEQAAPFLAAAAGDDDTTYGVAYDNSEVATAIGAEIPSIVVLRTFEEPRVEYEGDLTATADIAAFVSSNSLPLIVEFTQESAPKIFGGEVKQHVLIFVDAAKEDAKATVIESVTPVAKKFKGKLLFVTVDSTNDRIFEFFSIETADTPTVRIVDLDESGMKKYKYEDAEITEAGLTKFLEDFEAGKLAQDLKSEEPMEESEQGEVYVLVGKNFDDVVSRPGVGVLVEFYAPWCGHCKKLEPEYQKLGEHFKDNDKVLIAKMDATANEVESVSVTGFPTLKWFPADSEEIIDYEGDRDVEGMIAFVEKQLA